MKRQLFIAIIIFLILVSLILQIDDELEPPVITFLEKAQTKKHSQAYHYLMGIYAAAEKEPMLLGEKIANLAQHNEQLFWIKGEESASYHYPSEKKLSLPQGELFCSTWVQACLVTLFENSHAIENVLQEHEILFQRYQKFFQYKDYATLISPHIFETFPPFEYLVKGNRLLVLKSIHQAKSGNQLMALNILAENIKNIRQQLAAQDNLIGKMVFVALLSENIDMAYLISRDIEAEHHFKINPLTDEEKNLEVVMAREFKLFYESVKIFNQNPKSWNLNEYTPSWLINIFLKVNMTANYTFPVYQQVVENASLTPIEFSRKMLTKSDMSAKHSILRNSAGYFFFSDYGPIFNEYVARLFNLNTKIHLYNGLLNQALTQVSLEKIPNPNYRTQKNAYFSKNKLLACMDGALVDKRSLRCLRVKLK